MHSFKTSKLTQPCKSSLIAADYVQVVAVISSTAIVLEQEQFNKFLYPEIFQSNISAL